MRLTGERACVPVRIGAAEDDRMEILAIHDGTRESEQSWIEVIERLRSRSLQDAPLLAIGEGALGYRKAVSKTWPGTRHQRCRSHESMNALSKMPKSSQAAAKVMRHDIGLAETRAAAERAFERFVSTYEAMLPKAIEYPA
ncbi:MAG: transposase [Planctomycetota bacterium]